MKKIIKFMGWYVVYMGLFILGQYMLDVPKCTSMLNFWSHTFGVISIMFAGNVIAFKCCNWSDYR